MVAFTLIFVSFSALLMYVAYCIHWSYSSPEIQLLCIVFNGTSAQKGYMCHELVRVETRLTVKKIACGLKYWKHASVSKPSIHKLKSMVQTFKRKKNWKTQTWFSCSMIKYNFFDETVWCTVEILCLPILKGLWQSIMYHVLHSRYNYSVAIPYSCGSGSCSTIISCSTVLTWESPLSSSCWTEPLSSKERSVW